MAKLLPEHRDLLPIWFSLPLSFFSKLKQLADATGLESTEVLKNALSAYEREIENQVTESVPRPDSSPAALSKLRWSRMSPEQRSAFMQKISRRRWGNSKP